MARSGAPREAWWIFETDEPAAHPGPLSHRGRLLDLDTDLRAGLPSEELARALRHVILPLITVPRGRWSPDAIGESAGVYGQVQGFLVVSGVLTMNISLSGRNCSRLVLPGDLLLLDGVETDTLPSHWSWRVLAELRVLVFDQRLLTIGQHFPHLLSNLMARAALQTRHAFMQQAVSQLPRVEDRLLALFWSIADRAGTVQADGVRVQLPATHQVIADMVGARRPTVSLGLARLGELDLLRVTADGWVLNPASLERFAAYARQPGDRDG